MSSLTALRALTLARNYAKDLDLAPLAVCGQHHLTRLELSYCSVRRVGVRVWRAGLRVRMGGVRVRRAGLWVGGEG